MLHMHITRSSFFWAWSFFVLAYTHHSVFKYLYAKGIQMHPSTPCSLSYVCPELCFFYYYYFFWGLILFVCLIKFALLTTVKALYEEVLMGLLKKFGRLSHQLLPTICWE